MQIASPTTYTTPKKRVVTFYDFDRPDLCSPHSKWAKCDGFELFIWKDLYYMKVQRAKSGIDMKIPSEWLNLPDGTLFAIDQHIDKLQRRARAAAALTGGVNS